MNPVRKFSWNLVTRHLHPHEQLRKKLQQKIAKLAKHLQHFPTDAVHLHVALERHPKKQHFTAALTLRVPSNILRSRKASPDVIKAFDDAVKALFRELESLKAELRRETFWKRKERRDELRALKAAGFASLPPERQGPRDTADVVADFLRRHYERLLRHARRHVRHDELCGEIPVGAIDPRGVVDEVVRRLMREWPRKPGTLNWLVWCFRLVHEELRRRRQELQRAAAEQVPIEKTLPRADEAAEGYDAELPLNIVQARVEPLVTELRELIPDPATTPPDQAVAQKDLLEHLQAAAQTWPPEERAVFELHFVEGFEPDEVAMITGRPLRETRRVIAQSQERLRQALLAEAAL